LKQGLAVIVYSELHESINIVSKATFSSAPMDDIPE
ncbi:MAG: YheU family protein, partial [Aeromonas sp.]|nr:YheU family protein [Aeromonas sp.]MBP8051733.1 YheU family protein [Aeromonas sp.]